MKLVVCLMMLLCVWSVSGEVVSKVYIMEETAPRLNGNFGVNVNVGEFVLLKQLGDRFIYLICVKRSKSGKDVARVEYRDDGVLAVNVISFSDIKDWEKSYMVVSLGGRVNSMALNFVEGAGRRGW